MKIGRVVYKIKDYRIENGVNPEDQKSAPCEDSPIDKWVSNDEPG